MSSDTCTGQRPKTVLGIIEPICPPSTCLAPLPCYECMIQCQPWRQKFDSTTIWIQGLPSAVHTVLTFLNRPHFILLHAQPSQQLRVGSGFGNSPSCQKHRRLKLASSVSPSCWKASTLSFSRWTSSPFLQSTFPYSAADLLVTAVGWSHAQNRAAACASATAKRQEMWQLLLTSAQFLSHQIALQALSQPNSLVNPFLGIPSANCAQPVTAFHQSHTNNAAVPSCGHFTPLFSRHARTAGSLKLP